MVVTTSLGPLDDYPTIPAKNIEPGMVIQIGDWYFWISHVGHLRYSDRYVFGYDARYKADYVGFESMAGQGDSFNNNVKSTRLYQADEMIKVV